MLNVKGLGLNKVFALLGYFYNGTFLGYILYEIFIYQGLKKLVELKGVSEYQYLDWVYFFYFPNKKFIFYYYVLFMFSTWVFFLIATIFKLKNETKP